MPIIVFHDYFIWIDKKIALIKNRTSDIKIFTRFYFIPQLPSITLVYSLLAHTALLTLCILAQTAFMLITIYNRTPQNMQIKVLINGYHKKDIM